MAEMDNLGVFVKDERRCVVASSEDVARVLGVEHSRVMDTIYSIVCGTEFRAANFETLVVGEKIQGYYMTRDGFAMLASELGTVADIGSVEAYLCAYADKEASVCGMDSEHVIELIKAVRGFASKQVIDDLACLAAGVDSLDGRSESNAPRELIRRFAAERCIRERGSCCTRGEFYSAFCEWCRGLGIPSLSINLVGRLVNEMRLFDSHKTNRERLWMNVRVTR